ncbi:MAG: LOG family protein [Gammaproteobacteria bacterium]
MDSQQGVYPFLSVEEEVHNKAFSSYDLAFTDKDFMLREELRPIRLTLEYLKPEMILREQHIESTVVIFGSARLDSPEKTREKLFQAEESLKKYPKDPVLIKAVAEAKRDFEKSYYYDQARKLAFLISTECQTNAPKKHIVIVTGGGPGIMEAANRGAHEAKGISIGLNVLLPKEQSPNPYISPEVNFQFHYFALRKMHFLLRARAAVFFPGGYGTMDELFETLTLIQTKKMAQIPIILFGRDYWAKIINFDELVKCAAIDQEDRDYIEFAETPEETWEAIKRFYQPL